MRRFLMCGLYALAACAGAVAEDKPAAKAPSLSRDTGTIMDDGRA